ncbi:MAG: ribosomal-processing cysteine protease Prp [Spirochaetaceae bacterium]|nr:ribosomal-processing cysteine protease Prp [Spirochaetaceae bacterium]MBO5236995.1 ribosomal-processing cysteine protease Prp [Spirochaetaceae bacterium]
MTVVCLVCHKEGSFSSCLAKGHSGYGSKGSDILCAAISVLLRTTAQVLIESFGEDVEYDASTCGSFSLAMKKKLQVGSDKLVYAADFLRSGFKSLQQEFPKHILLKEEIID